MKRAFLYLSLALAIGGTAVAGDTPVPGVGPFGARVTPDGREVYVPLFGQFSPEFVMGDSAAVLDAASGAVVATIPTGLQPEDVAYSPDGKTAFITDSGSATLTVVDVATRTVLSTVEVGLPFQTFLFGVEVVDSPKGPRVYVTSTGGNYDGSEKNVFVVDANPASSTYLTVVDTIEATGGFTRPAFKRTGRDLVVPRGFPDNDFSANPRLSVFDLPSNALASEVTILPAPGGVHGIEDIALTPDGRFAYVAAFDWWGGTDEVFVVDIEEGRVSDIVRLGSGDTAQHGIASSPDGLLVLVTNFYAGTVSWVFTPTHTVIRHTPAGAGANEVAFAPGGRRFFVTNQLANSVSWEDVPAADTLVTLLVEEAIAAGRVSPRARQDLERRIAHLRRALASGHGAQARAALDQLVRRVRHHATAGEISIGAAKDLFPPAAGTNDVSTPLDAGGVDSFDGTLSTLSR
ncbi:MAG: YncE family protein [Planctomycetes bacterium]|nr:YncE family protein [Planctomycetota bacterium]